MTIPEGHAEQYKMLRSEIVALVDETRRVETQSVVATAALYAWLATHSESIPFGTWFLGFPLVLLASVRTLSLFHRIGFIASYLRIIEAKYLSGDSEMPGYERYFESHSTSRISPTSMALWVVLLLTTLGAPFAFTYHRPPPKPPAPVINIIGQVETPTTVPSNATPTE